MPFGEVRMLFRQKIFLKSQVLKKPILIYHMIFGEGDYFTSPSLPPPKCALGLGQNVVTPKSMWFLDHKYWKLHIDTWHNFWWGDFSSPLNRPLLGWECCYTNTNVIFEITSMKNPIIDITNDFWLGGLFHTFPSQVRPRV